MIYDGDGVKALANEMLGKHGTNPRELSRDAGLHRATIYSVLAGDKVSADTLRKFAEGLGEPAEPLLIAAGYPVPRTDSLPDFAEQTAANLRMFAGDKRPSVEEIEAAKRRIIEEFDRMERESGQ